MINNNKDPNKKINFKTGDAILAVLFFTSMGLTIWGINIYRLTIIDIKYLFVTIAFGAIIAFATLTYLVKSSYSTFWTYFIKVGIGSGLFYFGFLFFNKQFADKEFLTEDFQITKKGTLGRGRSSTCFQPYVVIDFYGTEKELLFYCDDAPVIKRSTKVNLTYSKGSFGFNIIKSKRLTD